MKHLRRFDTTSEYESYVESAEFVTPNVSLCKDTRKVEYNRYVAPETRVVAKYNVTSTSEPTVLRTSYEQNIFKSMEIDGVMLDELVTEYTFGKIGVHTVKYELYDETKLGNQAPVFYNNNLVECIIPDSVTSIGANAFINCYSLTSIAIPNSVTSIGESAFQSCNNLTSIVIPNGVTSIGNSTFYNCSSLTSIDIPNSVTSIGSYVFQNCNGLTSCTIGSSVTSIGTSAFQNCRSLTSITSNATTAPTIQNKTFQDIKTNGTLTVPNGSSGYDVWMGTGNYYLGLYNWTKVEQ